MRLTWKKYLLYASAVIFSVVLFFLLEETIRLRNTGFPGKSLWDWMELLVIPLVLVLGAYFLNRSERDSERKIATDRQNEVALQAYLDKIEDLLLKEHLRTSENEEIRDVARIRTLTVLRGLDARRKGFVIQFLSEAKLINASDPVINLEGADLRSIDLRTISLISVDLHGVFMPNASLSYADLTGANLKGAILASASLFHARLTGADLSSAMLQDADLELADLLGADLQGATLARTILNRADLTNANMAGAHVSKERLARAQSIKGATMPDGTKHE